MRQIEVSRTIVFDVPATVERSSKPVVTRGVEVCLNVGYRH